MPLSRGAKVGLACLVLLALLVAASLVAAMAFALRARRSQAPV